MITKLLIANRGEIALRILRACRDLGVPAVMAHSDADYDSLPVRLADEAVCIGAAPAAKSYNNIPAIITAAHLTGCDAIHPGYGFLAENPNLAEICDEMGLTFVGPSADVIERMGNKAQARKVMAAAGVPLLPGSAGIVPTLTKARQEAARIGYPVVIKAVAGGGGRGMRVATSEAELTQGYPLAQSEAESAFGNGDVYIERYLTHPRHIEVQILADSYGNVVAIGDRDCSLQRRHQKVVEEAPAPNLPASVRDALLEAAERGARAAGYVGAGTLEFLVNSDGEFYFMEMNTRIQVEHPITEEVTRLDLLAWQVRIASGEKLDFTRADLTPRGHAIECRINAEDAMNDFRPSTGTVETWVAPGGPGVRMDTHLFAGYTIPPYYDSLLGKMITWGTTRDEAIDRMQRALRELVLTGVTNTVPFHRQIMHDPEFRQAHVHTGFIPEMMERNGGSVMLDDEIEKDER